MRFDDRAAYRKPHPHAFRLCRDKRLEQTVCHLIDHTRPGIGNGNLNRAAICATRLEDDQSLLAVNRRDRIYGVSQKVEQHLLDFDVIGQDGWEPRIDPRYDFDLVLRCLCASKTHRGVDQRPYFDESSL